MSNTTTRKRRPRNLSARDTALYYIENHAVHTDTGCLRLVDASHGKNGYARIKYDGVPIDAHRFVYAALVGDIPDDLCVSHSCNVQDCINPDHLTLRTTRDIAKSRAETSAPMHYLGEAHWNARLTADDAREMRRLRDEEAWTRAQLADKFGVGKQQVTRILSRRHWKFPDDDAVMSTK